MLISNNSFCDPVFIFMFYFMFHNDYANIKSEIFIILVNGGQFDLSVGHLCLLESKHFSPYNSVKPVIPNLFYANLPAHSPHGQWVQSWFPTGGFPPVGNHVIKQSALYS